MDAYYSQHPKAALGHWYFLGSGGAIYGNWQLWTLVGLLFGTVFPQLQALGLDFAMVLTFISIVVPQLTRLPSLTAGAYLFKDVPDK
ncbi:putative branched-subunit amino acid permease [Oxalobacteraceae bacterium GrIS 1.11]